MEMDEKLKEVEDLFSRGVGEFIDPEGKFKEKLIQKVKGNYSKDIVIKFGVDPTRPDIHLGHAVVFRKLRKFQDLGCKIIFLVGDYTAQIGDPTGKSKVRPEIEQQEVEKNVSTFLAQVDRIIQVERDGNGQIKNTKTFSWIRNSDWFTAVTDIVFPVGEKLPLTIHDQTISVDANSFIGKAYAFESSRMQKAFSDSIAVITLSSFLWSLKHITHSALVERDMFKERIEKQEHLYMHEMMYPVLQGVDSHVLARIYGSCDLEVGGTDQTFNMLMGRNIMKFSKQEPQAVLAFKLLEGLDGKEKMSKSLDNYISITDEPNDMYGKVMSIPDASIPSYYALCTYTPLREVEEIKKDLEKGKGNPKDIKMRLAREIVALYHGEEKAELSEENFKRAFEKGGIPDDILEIEAKAGALLGDLLLEQRIVESKTDWRRLVSEGAVSFIDTGEKITDPKYAVSKECDLRIGKKRFVRIYLD